MNPNKISGLVARSLAAVIMPTILFAPVLLRAGVADDDIFTSVQAEQLEYRASDGDDAFAWDVQAWAGTDFDKIAIKTEGEKIIDGAVETAEFQLIYKRLISDFFDLQAGVRYDFEPDPSRVYGVLGFAGLAPYFFEIDANLFVSDQGDIATRFEVEYELLLTQRLVLQPVAEINIAFSDDTEIGAGSGVGDLELGLRLRYEFGREFAPYLGINWERKFGETADLARDEGEDVDVFSLVAGVRIQF